MRSTVAAARFVTILTCLTLAFTLAPTIAFGEEPDGSAGVLTEAAEAKPTLSGEAHVQGLGWLSANSVSAGQTLTLGTTGQSLRMEALRLSVEGVDDLAIEIKAHVQNEGWHNWRPGVCGTTGKSLRLEAMRIRLTGAAAGDWHLYYRTHVQNIGWLGWAADGALAGTGGLGLQLESVELVLKHAEEPAVSGGGVAWRDNGVSGTGHVQNIGWQNTAYALLNEGATTIGTTGRSLRLEAIRLWRPSNDLAGSIVFRAHVQNIGWTGEVRDGAEAGSTGRGLRLEAAKIWLTGEITDLYDVWYRAHVSNIGWMSWTKNGEPAGTEGFGARLEALQIALVNKGGNAPEASGQASASAFRNSSDASLRYASLTAGSWQDWTSSGRVSGTAGKSQAITGLRAEVQGMPGTVRYAANAGSGFSGYVSGGADLTIAGKPIEAIRLSLTGEVGQYYDVWYRTHVANVGWLGWTSNGSDAGSKDCGYAVEAWEARLLPKGSAAPGDTTRPLYAKPTVHIVQDIRSQFIHGDKGAEYQKYIVMHDTEGIAPAQNVVYGWVASGNLVAAHFVIGQDGTIVQCIPMDKIGHHAGYGDLGHNQKYGTPEDGRDDRKGTGVNPYHADYGMNSYSIGIELVHVSASHTDYPKSQLDALDALIAYIDDYYGFQSKIIDHKSWRTGNSDCSAEFQGYLKNLQSYRRTRP